MKKLILLMIVAALSFSSNAFATGATATGVCDDDGQTIQGAAPAVLDIARASKGVKFAWNTADTGYSIATYHSSGTKLYGTSYDSTALYFDDVGVDATLAYPTDSSADVAFADWTEM